MPLTALEWLEAESIHIFRELVAEAARPVMLYSGGKDSAVMLHLARKAFFPAPPPFPLLHIDTRWKFRAMYEMRDAMAAEAGMELIVHANPEAEARGINPFDHKALHTDMWKTEGLKQALDAHGFDIAFGGARRDEEASRAKERIVSVRLPGHVWDPKSQRPEYWRLFNVRTGPGETVRAFPLSNWTELDIWKYVEAERIAVSPLYFAAPRPTIARDDIILMVDDHRIVLRAGEEVRERTVRFRTLGCWPLTGAVESAAADVAQVIAETEASASSERHARAIDRDAGSGMEARKRAGYF